MHCRSSMVKMMRIGVLCFLSLACLSLDALCSPPPSPAASCAGTTTPFCGSSCSCTAQDDLKLREAYLGEVKAHGYKDAACRSQLKAYICAVCSVSTATAAPADDDPSSVLPLRCADDTRTKEAPTSTKSIIKWIFGVIGHLIAILGGGYGTYKYRTCSCFNRTTNIRVNATNLSIHNGEIQLTDISTQG